MELKHLVRDLGARTFDDTNDWYRWRPIDAKRVPDDVSLPEGNEYQQNLALKRALARAYRDGDEGRRVELTAYYVRDWGGIRSNRPDKLHRYALASPAELVALGDAGVASWSKALCIRDPETFAIYDNRVAFSLAALQALQIDGQGVLFPTLGSSRNKQIKAALLLVLRIAEGRRWRREPVTTYYRSYLRLLGEVATELGVALASVEMLLFAAAPGLATAVTRRA